MPDEVRRAVRGRWRWPGRPVAVEGVSTDTRTARAGDLFVALRGDRFDGHAFLAAAADAGCLTAVVGQDVALSEGLLERFGGGVIGVPDTTVALGDLAGHCRGHIAGSVVAVTGSNGKTTVKRMIDHILSRRLKGSGSPKSFNNAVGVPLTLFAVAADDDYVICEIGTSAPGQIAALARIARPDVAVITSVAETHLKGLVDLEHVAMEKAALLGGVAPAGVAVITADSEPLDRARRAYDVNLIRFGVSDAAELRLTGYEPRAGGLRFELNGRRWVDLAVPGRHNALNALAAIAVAQRLGFDQDVAAEALADYRGEAMRLEPIDADGLTILNDAYNANPASLAAGVEAMASYPGKRRVVVAGDMLDLGPRSAEMHLAAGRAVAAAGVDLVVGVGAMGRLIADGAGETGHVQAETIDSVEDAREILPSLLKRGDVVLLKGSRGAAMERLVEPIRAGRRKGRRAARGKGKATGC